MYIKQIIKAYGLTQKEVADRLDMNRVSLAITINEKNDIRLSTLHKIAGAIGCDVCELITGKVQPKEVASFHCPNCDQELSIVAKDSNILP